MTPGAAIVVTRPQPQADAFVAALAACAPHPVPAVAFPLLRIAPLDDPAPLHDAWAALRDGDFVMFVSANAVAAWFAATPPGRRWPAGALAGSTGPGTSAALRGAGLADDRILAPDASAGRFDSEALWLRIASRDWRGRRALVVRGEDGRDWLAERLREAGAEVGFVGAYRRLGPPADAPTLAALRSLHAHRHAWHFSSSEAIGHLRALATQAGLAAPDWAPLRAWATHPRIVAAARAAGFGRVEAVGPTPHALAQAWWGRAPSGAAT
jgi:uroporphyrinogen-III synthase